MCVNWFDRNDDQPEVDDGFYENRMTNAPLCATPWSNKQACGSKCQHIGMEKKQRESFSSSDRILLAVLVAFGLVMVGLIARKRYKMSNKDTLLEQASLSAAGLQQTQVLAIFVAVVVVIAVFAVLGLKNITWALLLIINTALFSYLMKLTIASSSNTDDTIIGPDGTIIRNDSDDSSVASANGRDGTYNLPVLD
jgi:predicted nucleic acid-binding Zn ribbon protein